MFKIPSLMPLKQCIRLLVAASVISTTLAEDPLARLESITLLVREKEGESETPALNQMITAFKDEFAVSVKECEERIKAGKMGVGTTKGGYTQAVEFYLGVRKEITFDKNLPAGRLQLCAIEAPLILTSASNKFTGEGGQDLDINLLGDGALAFRLALLKECGKMGASALLRDQGDVALILYLSRIRDLAARKQVLSRLNTGSDFDAVAAVISIAEWFGSASAEEVEKMCSKRMFKNPDDFKSIIRNSQDNSLQFVNGCLENNPDYAGIVAQEMNAILTKALEVVAADFRQNGTRAQEVRLLLGQVNAVLERIKRDKKSDRDAVKPSADEISANSASDPRFMALVRYADQKFLGQNLQTLKQLAMNINSQEERQRQIQAIFELATAIDLRKERLTISGPTEDLLGQAMEAAMQQGLSRFKEELISLLAPKPGSDHQ